MAINQAWLLTRLDEVKELFGAHPRDAGENYVQHLCFALLITGRLLYAAVALCIHAFLPFTLTYTASRQIARINAILAERKARMEAYYATAAEQPDDA